MKKEKTESDTSKQGKAKKIVLIIVCVILALILLLLAAVTIFSKYFLSKIDRTSPEDDYTLSQEELDKLEEQQRQEEQNPTAPTVDPTDVTWNTTPVETVDKADEKTIYNILLIGQDRRPGEGRARSDAMILCTINTKENTLTLTSFLRDLYVQIPGYQDTRLNTAYALGGMDLLDESILVNFGVEVDHNVEVDFEAFEHVIDAVGGVDISLTGAEAGYMSFGNDWALTEGANHLNGQQALVYSRIRSLDSDFGRTNRQRNVINSLVESIRGASLDQIWNIANALLPMVKTDMTDTDILKYITTFFPLLKNCHINNQRIPTDDGYEYATIRGMAVILPYLDVNRAFLTETLS